MEKMKPFTGDFCFFILFSALGTAVIFINVKIPHTEVLIDGRWAVGFVGFVFLRWNRAFLLAACLSVPHGTDISFFTGFFGNMMYAVPCLLTIRTVHSRYLLKSGPILLYAAGWFFLVLLCYQLFITPAVWFVLAVMQGLPVWQHINTGWHTQPFFAESLLVASISASVMSAIQSYIQLVNSRKELEITLHSIGDGVISTDTDGCINRINKTAEILIGRDAEQAYGKPLHDVFHLVCAETKSPVKNPAEEVLLFHHSKGLEKDLILISKDGSEYHITASAAPIQNEKGESAGAVITFKDMSAEYAAAEELRIKEEKYRNLFDNAGEAIFVTQNGTIKFPNPMTLKISGYSKEELTKISFLSLVHPEDRDTVQQRHRKRVSGENVPNTYSFRIINKAGEMLWVQLNVVRIHWEGHPATLNFIRDISELKILENRLQQAQKMEAIGNLAGGVAHDYNNISSIIIGYSEMALEKAERDSSLYSDIHEILKAAMRSADITRQLLAFARRQTAAPQTADLNDTVEGMLEMLRRLIGEDIRLSWFPAAELWPVKIDPAQMNQILVNLCINARDAVAGVGNITIETGNITFDQEYCDRHSGFIAGEFVMLALSDDGSGIAPEILDKIFDPFFTTKGPGAGTGLGLATVYGIVKQNKGFINIYSEPEKGTLVKVYIPRHQGKTLRKIHKDRQKTPLSCGETVLLVEDDESILKLCEKVLGSLGYKIISANTPKKAISLADKNETDIDLLITDVIMPEMSGKELSHHLMRSHPRLKTLYMSGYTADIISYRGVLDEGVFFIQKPFSRRDMAVKIRETLDNSNGGENSILKIISRSKTS
ncbi:MAG: PAS domain S-box protein [Desulfococcaceae bacterium]|nr:PAS domain S-box protein [Desulfococcaceae bacterium]